MMELASNRGERLPSVCTTNSLSTVPWSKRLGDQGPVYASTLQTLSNIVHLHNALPHLWAPINQPPPFPTSEGRQIPTSWIFSAPPTSASSIDPPHSTLSNACVSPPCRGAKKETRGNPRPGLRRLKTLFPMGRRNPSSKQSYL